MADTQEIYNRLLARGYQETLFSDLEGLRRSGRETAATCPFCGKAGKFSFSSEKPLWRCWSSTCGRAGDWIAYLQERRGLEFREALELLAREAGVELSGADHAGYQATRRRADILEAAQELFRQALSQPEGQEVAKYLEARGYTPEEIQGMELGAYTGGQERLQQALEGQGYSRQEIQDAGLLTRGFGSTHTLALLWRDPAGRAIGLACRAIREGVEPKYKYSAGLEKGAGLVGLERARGQARLLLVEGVLDALYLAAQGLPAVAVGGTDFSSRQLQAVEHNRTQELLLALDADEAGQQGTVKILEQLRGSTLRAYVVSLPAGYKDPDELVRAEGLEALQRALGAAESGSRWQARHICSLHDLSTDQGRDRALSQALEAWSRIEDGLERRDFLEALQAATGLSAEDLAYRSYLQAQRAAQSHSEAVAKASLRAAQERLSEGDLLAVEEELAQGLQRLRSSRGVTLPEPYPMEALAADLRSTGEGLATGYQELDALCRIPQGALTIVAGRPGHGKTTLQLNLLLNLAQRYPEHAFYFFSYEEARRALAVKLIMILAGEVVEPHSNYGAYVAFLKDLLPGEHREISKAFARYGELADTGRICLADGRRTAEDLAATIGALADRAQVGAVFVDYIQKIPLQRPAEVRYLEIKRVSELLLEQAVSHDLPIILGAQLGRAQGQQRKVTLDNLRESGDIEQDANLVLGLHNAAVEAAEESESAGQGQPEVPLEVVLLKNRAGVAGRKVVLNLQRPTFRIQDKPAGSSLY